jgi:Icc-related predicted phosphoesterase
MYYSGKAMRIQIASDLHLERYAEKFPDFRGVEKTDADVLVLAGDICKGTEIFDLFADWPCPVIYVPGKHEYLPKRAVNHPNIRVLSPGVTAMGNIRFIGCTLWTDYELFGIATRLQTMAECAQKNFDHSVIKAEPNERFSPAEAQALHWAQRHWLTEALALPFDGTTIVITHHAPHPKSVHTDFASFMTSSSFVSDLSSLMGTAEIHIHGHVHASFDYRVKGTRVVANPLGHCRGMGTAQRLTDLRRENTRFDARMILDV